MFTEVEMKVLTLWRDWCVKTQSDVSFENWLNYTHDGETITAIQELFVQRFKH